MQQFLPPAGGDRRIGQAWISLQSYNEEFADLLMIAFLRPILFDHIESANNLRICAELAS
jgi:hypothetical protein